MFANKRGGIRSTKEEVFYYDGFYGALGLNEDHFKRIESEAIKVV